MSDTLPEGEALRRAVRWISEQLGTQEQRPPLALVDEAATRFDLTPLQAEYLLGFYRKTSEKR